MKRARTALLAALVLLAFTQPTLAAPKVVVTIKPLHALVAQVMAGVANPEILVKGFSSPHLYALKPSDIAALSGADIVFRASAAVEPFTGKIAQTLPKQVNVVTLQETPGVVLFERRSQLSFQTPAEARPPPTGTSTHAIDGHIWLDPENAKAMVDRIEQVLSAKDPVNADSFQRNAIDLKHKLDALGAELEQRLAPLAGKPYLVAHDAFQYLEHRFKLNVVGVISL